MILVEELMSTFPTQVMFIFYYWIKHQTVGLRGLHNFFIGEQVQRKKQNSLHAFREKLNAYFFHIFSMVQKPNPQLSVVFFEPAFPRRVLRWFCWVPPSLNR